MRGGGNRASRKSTRLQLGRITEIVGGTELEQAEQALDPDQSWQALRSSGLLDAPEADQLVDLRVQVCESLLAQAAGDQNTLAQVGGQQNCVDGHVEVRQVKFQLCRPPVLPAVATRAQPRGSWAHHVIGRLLHQS